MKLKMLAASMALAACDPQVVVDKAVARTAEAVIAPVMGPQAARCIADNGSPQELQVVARDIGVEAGTATVANIMVIARRPATLACFAASGAVPLRS